MECIVIGLAIVMIISLGLDVIVRVCDTIDKHITQKKQERYNEITHHNTDNTSYSPDDDTHYD